MRVNQHDLREGLADRTQLRHFALVAEPQHVLRKLGLAGDAAAALLGGHGQEALLPEPVDHGAGRNVGVTAGPAFVRLGGEGGRSQRRNLLVVQRAALAANVVGAAEGVGDERHRVILTL